MARKMPLLGERESWVWRVVVLLLVIAVTVGLFVLGLAVTVVATTD